MYMNHRLLHIWVYFSLSLSLSLSLSITLGVISVSKTLGVIFVHICTRIHVKTLTYIHINVYTQANMCFYPSIHLSSTYLSLHPCIPPSLHPSMVLSMYLSISIDMAMTWMAHSATWWSLLWQRGWAFVQLGPGPGRRFDTLRGGTASRRTGELGSRASWQMARESDWAPMAQLRRPWLGQWLGVWYCMIW